MLASKWHTNGCNITGRLYNYRYIHTSLGKHCKTLKQQPQEKGRDITNALAVIERRKSPTAPPPSLSAVILSIVRLWNYGGSLGMSTVMTSIIFLFRRRVSIPVGTRLTGVGGWIRRRGSSGSPRSSDVRLTDRTMVMRFWMLGNVAPGRRLFYPVYRADLSPIWIRACYVFSTIPVTTFVNSLCNAVDGGGHEAFRGPTSAVTIRESRFRGRKTHYGWHPEETAGGE